MKQALRLIVAALLSCSILSATGTVVTVADKAYLAQTSTPITTVYTTTATGNFRVCMYATETTFATDGYTLVTAEWTDEGPTFPDITSVRSDGSNAPAQGCVPIHALASTPIQVSASIGTGGVYDLFVTVERLP